MATPTKTANKPAGEAPKAPLTEEQKAAAKAKAAAAKAERFKKLGELRVPKLLAALDAVKSLGNRKAYAYTDEQAKKITDAVAAKVKELNDSFAGESGGFKL